MRVTFEGLTLAEIETQVRQFLRVVHSTTAEAPAQLTIAEGGGQVVDRAPADADAAPYCPNRTHDLTRMAWRKGGSKVRDGKLIAWPAFYSCPIAECRETAEIEAAP